MTQEELINMIRESPGESVTDVMTRICGPIYDPRMPAPLSFKWLLQDGYAFTKIFKGDEKIRVYLNHKLCDKLYPMRGVKNAKKAR